VRIQMREMLGGVMPELIRSGAVDFAFALDPMSGNDIRSVAILAEDLCLVGQHRLVEAYLRHSTRERFSFRDLDGLPLYMARKGQFIRDTVEQTATSKGITLNLRGEVDSHHILRELALGGAGACILPPTSVLRERGHHDLYVGRITAPLIRREAFLVHRRETSLAAAAVIALAMDLIESLITSGAWQATLKAGALDIRKSL
jgi:DNA-binding transcriptional LysR family regulator